VSRLRLLDAGHVFQEPSKGVPLAVQNAKDQDGTSRFFMFTHVCKGMMTEGGRMDFQAGDRIKLNSEGLESNCVPSLLVRTAGFKNGFLVRRFLQVQEEGQAELTAAVTLVGCCHDPQYPDEDYAKNPQTGLPMCNAHHARLFELMERGATAAPCESFEKPAYELSLQLPVLGKVFSVEHFKREGVPSSLVVKLPFLGPVALSGKAADGIADQLRSLNII
jgi:hypothetical protein